jgi:hypothetical protein
MDIAQARAREASRVAYRRNVWLCGQRHEVTETEEEEGDKSTHSR